MFFTSQLALLLETGSNLTESLEAVAMQTQNPRMRQAILHVTADVTAGKMLSTALARQPRIFSTMYVSMVRAGEMGGFQAEMLARMTQFQKLHEGLKSKIRTALAYPAILTVISAGVAIFMITFVLPRFITVFEGKEAVLPMTTKVLMTMTRLLTRYWWLVLLSVTAMLGGILWFMRTEFGRKRIDRTKLRIPLVGAVYRAMYTSRLLRTLGVMLESGIPLLDGLEVTRGTVGSDQYKGFLDQVADNVKQGRSLSEPFTKSPLFPPAVKQMVSTSEMTGSCGTVMIRMADYYDEEVENQLRALTALLEPAVVVVMGAVVGFIALSLFLPLFKLSRGLM
jgi:type II secretory pathway component PulF